MPICDSSAGVRFWSCGRPTTSHPRCLAGTTSSIRPHCRSGSDVPRAAPNRQALLLRCSQQALDSLPDPGPPGPLQLSLPQTFVLRSSLLRRMQFLLAHVVIHHCLSDAFTASHPSLSDFASAPTCATRHPSQSSENPHCASSTSRRM